MIRSVPAVLMLSLVACGGLSTQSEDPVEPPPALAEAVLEDTMLEDAVPMASFDEPFDTDVPEIAELSAVGSEPEPVLARFALRRGETLHHFARWSGFPVEDIAEQSELELDGDYPVGTELLIAAEGEALAEIEQRRESHWTRRVEGYLASRGGAVSSEFYKVRTGDSAWTIARKQYGMPVWMLDAYNPSVDLDHLRPGQELMVPVLADIVVDAAEPEPSIELE